MKICIVSSCGGHLTEVRQLLEVYKKYDYFYVLNNKIQLPEEMQQKTYFIKHSERDYKFIFNIYESYSILKKERPDIILTTGAGPAVPFALVSKLFFLNISIIYIETVTRIEKPSLTGVIMYRLADYFYYQSKKLNIHFPKGEYKGTLI